METQIRILEWLIKFFTRIKTNADRIIHQLRFMKYELKFGEREDDIYVATYLKSGTTWMQMILYQLTTKGEVDFEHIYDVSPWLRNLADRGLEIPELPSPRIIKTHDPYHKIQKGKKGRFIYVVRDGRDVALSLFHHRKNYNNSKISVEENFELSFRDKDDMNWFEFNSHWLQNKNKHQILYVRYEDLQENFVKELFRIAGFIGVEIQHEDVPRIVERSSFSFMKAHESKFGEQPPKEKHEIVFNQFIREGKVGAGKETLKVEDLQFFNQEFNTRLSKFPQMKRYLAEVKS